MSALPTRVAHQPKKANKKVRLITILADSLTKKILQKIVCSTYLEPICRVELPSEKQAG
jgi:hypothetical protein